MPDFICNKLKMCLGWSLGSTDCVLSSLFRLWRRSSGFLWESVQEYFWHITVKACLGHNSHLPDIALKYIFMNLQRHSENCPIHLVSVGAVAGCCLKCVLCYCRDIRAISDFNISIPFYSFVYLFYAELVRRGLPTKARLWKWWGSQKREKGKK